MTDNPFVDPSDEEARKIGAINLAEHVQEYGTEAEWQANLKENYWDLSEWFAKLPVYTDFGGPADPDEVKAIMNDPAVVRTFDSFGFTCPGQKQLVRDLTVHYVHVYIGAVPSAPSTDTLIEVILAFGMLTDSRYYMKVRDEDLN